MSSSVDSSERLKQIITSLEQEVHPHRLLPTLFSGGIASISTVIYAISFASLIYWGELAPHLSSGIGFGLIAIAILNIVAGLLSSLPGMIIMMQDAPLVLVALMAQTIAVKMAGADSAVVFATVLVALGLTAFLTGIGAFLLGRFKLGNLVRFVPYPVVGGFLAGTGWLLSLGAISLLIDQPVALTQIIPTLQSAALLNWLPGCAFGLVLLIAMRRFSYVLLLPGLLLSGVLLFYVALMVTGTSIAEAHELGLFLNLSTSDTLLPAVPIASFSQVDWAVIATEAGTMIGVLLITILGLLLNATGIELATGQEMNLNRELQATGIANIGCGLSGGMIGFHALGLSTLSYAKLGVRSRFAGLIVSLVNLLVLFTGMSLIELFPKFVLGGLLLFLGLEFLADWLYATWSKLPKLDYFIVLLISLVITIVGFLQGVGLGLAIAIVLFVISYSRISVAKHIFSGTGYQSNQVRPLPQVRLLRERGDQIHILSLQGFLFFGTVNQLLFLIRRHIQTPNQTPLKFVVFDFRSVVGIDSSAVFGFVKLKQLAQEQAFNLVFTSLSPSLQHQLQQGGCFSESSIESIESSESVETPAEFPVSKIFPDLDRGLEWCENQILSGSAWRRRRTLPLPLQIDPIFATQRHAAVFMAYLEVMAIKPGQELFRQGDPVSCLYFVHQGQITTWRAADDGKRKRIQTAGAGNMVGEIDFFLDRSRQMSAVVDEPGQVYSLSKAAFTKMQQDHPDVAVTFQNYVIHLLSEHLARSYQEME